LDFVNDPFKCFVINGGYHVKLYDPTYQDTLSRILNEMSLKGTNFRVHVGKCRVQLQMYGLVLIP